MEDVHEKISEHEFVRIMGNTFLSCRGPFLVSTQFLTSQDERNAQPLEFLSVEYSNANMSKLNNLQISF